MAQASTCQGPALHQHRCWRAVATPSGIPRPSRPVAQPFPSPKVGAALRNNGPATRQRLQAAAVDAPPAPAADIETVPISQVDPKAKYAVVDIGGGQLLIEEGRWYTVNQLEAEPGSKIQLGRVLALKNEGKFSVGTPYLENVKVEAEVLEDLRGPKVVIFKYQPKKHVRTKTGHRQPLTKFRVTKISTV